MLQYKYTELLSHFFFNFCCLVFLLFLVNNYSLHFMHCWRYLNIMILLAVSCIGLQKILKNRICEAQGTVYLL